MFNRFLLWIFNSKPEKTMLENALQLLSGFNVVSGGKTITDPISGGIYILYKKDSPRTIYTLNFSSNGEDVVIKHNKDILYYFNTKEETVQVRDLIISIYNDMQSASAAVSK